MSELLPVLQCSRLLMGQLVRANRLRAAPRAQGAVQLAPCWQPLAAHLLESRGSVRNGMSKNFAESASPARDGLHNKIVEGSGGVLHSCPCKASVWHSLHESKSWECLGSRVLGSTAHAEDELQQQVGDGWRRKCFGHVPGLRLAANVRTQGYLLVATGALVMGLTARKCRRALMVRVGTQLHVIEAALVLEPLSRGPLATDYAVVVRDATVVLAELGCRGPLVRGSLDCSVVSQRAGMRCGLNDGVVRWLAVEGLVARCRGRTANEEGAAWDWRRVVRRLLRCRVPLLCGCLA